MIWRICAFWLVLATAAQAEERVMSPAEFEALSTRKTLYFWRDGAFFGAEQFYNSRRSTWQLADGTCADGVWHAEGPLVCFVYDPVDGPICWTFVDDGGAVSARPKGAEDASRDVILGHIDDEPLDCAPPEFGA